MEPARTPETGEIARRAYALWEKEGRPHGRDRDHWVRAERELGSERVSAAERGTAGSAKAPARARKAVAAAAATDPVVKPARKPAPAPKAAATDAAAKPARRKSTKPA
jgi:Protein of unknown function (DUF2934)